MVKALVLDGIKVIEKPDNKPWWNHFDQKILDLYLIFSVDRLSLDINNSIYCLLHRIHRKQAMRRKRL